MGNGSLDRALAALATLAALTVACMVAAILTTHGSQDFFQTARPLAAYGAYLATPLANPPRRGERESTAEP